MAAIEQLHEKDYSLFNGDSLEILPDIPSESVHLTVYSPPFAKEGGGALYTYSSSPRDFSNAVTYQDFFDGYTLLAKEIARITKPGCFSAVHAMDVPESCNLGNSLTDFPGDIIRMHQSLGFDYVSRHVIWKEPLAVRNRTMAKGLAHMTIVENSNLADVAGGDYVLMLRKKGERESPVAHPNGLLEYFGAQPVPHELHRFRGWTGDQKENRYSHWIWRRYASCIWDDIRGTLGEFDKGTDYAPVLPYEEARDKDDEKHVHPLQLDVIARCLELRTNPGDVVLSPFAGVGSEVYQAVRMGRRGIGVELKPSYYRQAVKNCATATAPRPESMELFPV
jgi:DNA modification methylase